LKILILSASYPPVLGGLQTVVQALAQNLQQRGHDIRVVTNRYPRSLPSSEEINGINVLRLLFLKPEFQYLFTGRLDLFAASFYYHPAAQLALNQLIQDFQPDVVNLHFPDVLIPFVLKLREKFHFRLVVSIHGDDVLRWFDEQGIDLSLTKQKDVGYRRLQLILQQADVVTACSQALLYKAMKISPEIMAKSQAIQNGVDFHRFIDKSVYYYHLRPYILAYGRLVYRKGFDLLLDAFLQFSLNHPDIDLILAGEGEQFLELKAMCAQKGISDRILFFGRAGSQMVVHLLNGCIFAVFPSRQEPFGIVALEALAAGKPVLATKVGGMAELLTQYPEYAHMVEPNVDALADGLEEMLRVLPSFASLPRLSLDQYSWENVAEQYEKILCA
jgi:glycosyltransferase involved in cell wall biosynthesis